MCFWIFCSVCNELVLSLSCSKRVLLKSAKWPISLQNGLQQKPRPEKREEGQSYSTSSSYDVRYCPLHLWALFTRLWNNVWLFGSGDPRLCCHHGELSLIIIKTAPFLEPIRRCWYFHALTCGILHRRTFRLRVTKWLTQGCTVRKQELQASDGSLQLQAQPPTLALK